MKTIILFTISTLIFACTVGKETAAPEKVKPIVYPAHSSDWTIGNCPCEEVSVYLMEEKEPPIWFNLVGEDLMNLTSDVQTMEQIPTKVLDKMKSRAQEAGSCVVFVDLRDYYTSSMFPVRTINKVYFYWGTCK